MIDVIAQILLLTTIMMVVLGFVFRDSDYKRWAAYCFVPGILLYLFGFYLTVLIFGVYALVKYFDKR